MPKRTRTLADIGRLLNRPFDLLFREADAENGPPLDRSASRLVLVSFLLLVFGGFLAPPNDSPVWLTLAWMVLSVCLICLFLLYAYRTARALVHYRRRGRG
jgi:hypothetical protein